LLFTANVVPSSPILFTLMMEAICSSETSVLLRSIRHHIQEDGFVYSIAANPLQPSTFTPDVSLPNLLRSYAGCIYWRFPRYNASSAICEAALISVGLKKDEHQVFLHQGYDRTLTHGPET
jgi:hypothetical protein